MSGLDRAIRRSEGEVREAMEKTRMWQEIVGFNLNERQKKVINRLFEAGEDFEGGLTTSKYMGMIRTTSEAAKRDIADLVFGGVPGRSPAGGRGSSY